MTPRPIRIQGDVAYVPLTQGYEAVIDAGEAPMVDGRNWHAMVRTRPDGAFYAVYAVSFDCSCGKRRKIFMHRVIAGTPDEMDTDHIDGDGLNNRRSNLRHATKSQNRHNQRISVCSTSGVKGVSWHKSKGKWQARIKLNGTRLHLGLFEDIELAAAAYASASAKMHGEFGRLE